MNTQSIASRQNLSAVDNKHASRLDEHRPLKVEVVAGTAYLTREGDRRDYVLTSGDAICFEENGQIVVQGLPFTQYRVLVK